MSSTMGINIKISIFGQSHSPAIGVVVDGLPPGEAVDETRLQAFLARRAPGQGAHTTARKEADEAQVLSGLAGGVTCGAPLCIVISNQDARPQDYAAFRAVPRPSHADYAAFAKYGQHHDIRGGGHCSGRLTAALCAAGGVCAQILERRNIVLGAHIAAIGPVADASLDPVHVSADQLRALAALPFPVLEEAAGEAMRREIAAAKAEGDSIGGVVEACAVGMPAGAGEPIFHGLENALAQAVFAIPAVKGVEFGLGFAAARLRGSQNNDAFYFDQAGRVRTRTNRHGGSLGGISTGMPILLRAAFKPTPTIAREQESVNLHTKESAKLVGSGRHDPCVVPRAVPCVEAAMAVVLLDLLLSQPNK